MVINYMVVAVTGGGGFIGSRLIRGLCDMGTTVRALLGPPGFEVIDPPNGVEVLFGEIDDSATILSLVRDTSTVVHLAGQPSVAASFHSAPAYARVHVNGTATVVDACIRSGVSRLVYVSSAEVYGQPEQNPIQENAPLLPRSPYAAAKVGAEVFVRVGAAIAGFEAVIFRPFLVYGPGMSSASLVSSLIRQVRWDDVIEISDPRPVRDYCFVDDVVNAMILGCSAALLEPVRVYNVGSGVGISVAEMAERVLAAAGRTGSVRVSEMSDRPSHAEIVELVSDSTRASKELKWQATIDIDAGLTEMLRSTFDESR